jgi:hypothetical protein
MAAHSLLFGTVIAHLPFMDNGTCQSSAGNVRRVNVSSSPRLRYTVFAGASAIKVGLTSDAAVLADNDAASTTDYVDVPAYGSFDLVIGRNSRTGAATVSQFYIWSSVVDAPYSIGVAEVE